MKKFYIFIGLLFLFANQGKSQSISIAREWNGVHLEAIKTDFARPPVHARTLFHNAVAMYDAWAVYDTSVQTYLLGKTLNGFTCPFNGIPEPADREAARHKAISYAAYRLLSHRFQTSPTYFFTLLTFQSQMTKYNYDFNFSSIDYTTGDPAALGNYIAKCVIDYGLQDGSNESLNYAPVFYKPINPPLIPDSSGNRTLIAANRWQPLNLTVAVDQNGNPIPSLQKFQSPEWGHVKPFALKDSNKVVYQDILTTWPVYHDPGPFPTLDTVTGGGSSDEYKWHFALVSAWSSHLDPTDGVMWDISPKSQGNVQSYPQTLAEQRDFYDFENGGDTGTGHALNPATGQPYAPNIVPRGDYTRVLAQFWADGPNSETPPGHWFSIMNKAFSHPEFSRRFNGKGPKLSPLEWDVKAYLVLGGALHDAAVTAWGIKGWYDGVRPVSAIRYMGMKGQSSDSLLPSYHPAGLPLIPGFIELVQPDDVLAFGNPKNINKVKVKAWRGFNVNFDPFTQSPGVGWILAENWWPYQRRTFVTPPFGGYISGHSTYSRSAAEAMTLLTGSPFFPGGMAEYEIKANSMFLGLEKGPSVDVTLQWATYSDASDQTSLSRIWGGIHPPFDDIPGRLSGMKIGPAAYHLAKSLFYKDADGDGYFTFEDCDDSDSAVNPGAPEICDGRDNNCNGLSEEGLPLTVYYQDNDGDGDGTVAVSIASCLPTAPQGYSPYAFDCNDFNPAVYLGAPEVCDGVDNDCNGQIDEKGIYTHYLDADGDGFGRADSLIVICDTLPPSGYVGNAADCNDDNPLIFPGATDVCDGLDNDCNGQIDENPAFTHYLDADGDGFGTSETSVKDCTAAAPAGYANNSQDCNDADPSIRPDAIEICDGKDNNCDNKIDDLPVFTYFVDADKDGFGVIAGAIDTCLTAAPSGYVTNNTDCDDTNANINPAGWEGESPNGLDENCNGLVDDISSSNTPYLPVSVSPNPFNDVIEVRFDGLGALEAELYDLAGKLILRQTLIFYGNLATLRPSSLPNGAYLLKLFDPNNGARASVRVVKG